MVLNKRFQGGAVRAGVYAVLLLALLAGCNKGAGEIGARVATGIEGLGGGAGSAGGYPACAATTVTSAVSLPCDSDAAALPSDS